MLTAFENILSSLLEMQIVKNSRYANSALQPLHVFDHLHPYGARLDEKLARVSSSGGLRKNDVADIIGGCVLLLMTLEDPNLDSSVCMTSVYSKLRMHTKVAPVVDTDDIFLIHRIFCGKTSKGYEIDALLNIIAESTSVEPIVFADLVYQLLTVCVYEGWSDFKDLID